MAEKTSPTEIDPASGSKLRKELGLGDVYCIGTGAMFSSGFFLLPGLAAAQAGAVSVLAYLAAGLLMVPSMLSMAELSTALPRAGGSYFFVDRSLGPGVGAVTGIGTWLALILKSAFALVGMGAYLAVAPGLAGHLPLSEATGMWLIKAIAVGLTGLFVAINILGAKESTRLQKLLVVAILGILGLFLIEGFWHVSRRMSDQALNTRLADSFAAGPSWAGLGGTIGLVFISYAGLTKVASISEEVRRPERNLPLGMVLSLATATVVYALGMIVMVTVLSPDQLHGDLTPVATATSSFAAWLGGPVSLILVIIAAVAAFASTGNAGILSASRYPLAMARDDMAPRSLAALGRFRTPTRAILLTGAVMVVFILALSAEQVAKLGSTFNLLVFGLINLAVIVMRESRIDSYDPGFRVPLYPWMPLAGMLISGWLILEMGWMTSAVAVAVILAGAGWYVHFARPRVDRAGAIRHVFARLGRLRHRQLRTEFREIMKEKGLREEDPYDEILERAEVIDLETGQSFDQALQRVAEALSSRVGLDADRIAEKLRETGRYGGAPISHGIALLHFRSARVDRPELALARAADGLCVSLSPDDPAQPDRQSCDVHGLYALVSPEAHTGQHLRILAELADRAEDETFRNAWRRISDPQRLKETLLRDARFLELFAGKDPATQELVDAQAGEIQLPADCFLALIRRDEQDIEPRLNTRLQHGDRLTFLGQPDAIEQLYERFIDPEAG